VPPFILPSLVVAIPGFLILAVLRRLVDGVLPSYGSLALVFLGIVAQTGSLFLGMFIGGHFQSPIGLWIGKLASVGGTLLFIWLCKSQASWREMGLRSSQPKTISLTTGLFFVMAGVTWFLAHCYAPRQAFSMGAFAFMLLLSGTDEELLFRGAMPALLRRADETERWQRAVNTGLVFTIPFHADARLTVRGSALCFQLAGARSGRFWGMHFDVYSLIDSERLAIVDSA
jgi:hypothetical protein